MYLGHDWRGIAFGSYQQVVSGGIVRRQWQVDHSVVCSPDPPITCFARNTNHLPLLILFILGWFVRVAVLGTVCDADVLSHSVASRPIAPGYFFTHYHHARFCLDFVFAKRSTTHNWQRHRLKIVSTHEVELSLDELVRFLCAQSNKCVVHLARQRLTINVTDTQHAWCIAETLSKLLS